MIYFIKDENIFRDFRENNSHGFLFYNNVILNLFIGI